MTPKAEDASFRTGRLKKAREFADAAALFFDSTSGNAELADAYVTLAVHAGIAASDVICAARLGEYSASESHAAALTMLRKADPDAAKHLGRLLAMKTKAGYAHRSVSAHDAKAADRAHKALLEAAERI